MGLATRTTTAHVEEITMRRLQRYRSQLSKSYIVSIDENIEGNWDVSIIGPTPLKHGESIPDLENAKLTAHTLGIWHFKQKGINETVVPESARLEWVLVRDTEH